MNRTFYGYCQNEPINDVYRVIVQDDYINTQNNFQFERGDVLTVFFASKQIASAPRLAIYVNDTEQESSISDDEGHFVKTLDIKLDGIDQAWDAGETVIFVYTKQGDSDTYYWELVNAAPATVEVYGVTKLFNVANLDAALSGDYTPLNDTVLTPEALKNFYDKLMAAPEEEESPLGLTWVPNAELGDRLDKLGELSLSNGTTSIEINYPLESLIDSKIPSEKTHTGELINNGNGGTGEGHERDESEPFITRIIPDDLYFNVNHGLYYYSPDSERQPQDGTPLGIPRIILDTDKVVINPNLEVKNAITSGAITCGAITASGTINAGSNTIQTTGSGKAAIFYEDNVSLIQKYSTILHIESRQTTVNLNNDKNSKSYAVGDIPATKNGWTPLGVVGYNLTNSSNSTGGTGASYCYPYSLMLYNSNVRYNIRNTNKEAKRIILEVLILYRKN